MAEIRHFGHLADGSGVEAVTLGHAEGLQAEVLTYGAILRRLSLPVRGQRRELILAMDRPDAYERDTAYVGAVVGRFANRIAAGRFSIGDQAHQLTRNEKGNHLHGGSLGTGKRLWRLTGTPSETAVRLALHSPAGEEGYPGALDISVEMSVGSDSLRVEFTAQADAPTPVNLTCHPYFNLGGDVADHWLRIPASRYLPVLPGLIPTGEMAPVEGTPFDFRVGRRLAPPPLAQHSQLSVAGGYDHCWIIDEGADCHCELRSAADDLSLKILASGPGLQFYGGQYLRQAHPEFSGGIALEPQQLPDSPNHPAFPDTLLRPGRTWRAFIELQLRVRPPG